MFGFFRNKKSKVEHLVFKSGEAAFQHACEFMTGMTLNQRGDITVGLVTYIDTSKGDDVPLGCIVSLQEGDRVITGAALHVVDEDIAVGDFISFVVHSQAPNGMVSGAIHAKLKIEYSLLKSGWESEWAYDPEGILGFLK